MEIEEEFKIDTSEERADLADRAKTEVFFNNDQDSADYTTNQDLTPIINQNGNTTIMKPNSPLANEKMRIEDLFRSLPQ